MAPARALETGIVYCDDNLDRLKAIPEASVDLIYLDPPFFSNKVYEVIWGDEAEVRSFADRWEGGINVYVEWMRERMALMHRALKPTGSIFLHCDAAAGHYLKVMMDEIFGRANFRNEIIWRRTGSNSAAKRFGPLHQTIFYYGKTKKSPFYPVYAPYTAAYVNDYFTEEDSRGRYRPVLLTGPGKRRGDSGKPWRHYDPTDSGRHWQPASYVYEKYRELTGDDLAKYPLVERLERLDGVGLIHWPKKKDGVPNYRYYLADAPGVALQDLWGYQPGTEGAVYGHPADGIDQDVKWLGTKDRERLGYPTQKPEGVLERIIKSATQRGDIVLDPFCGCGTSVAVAQRLGREWVGIDISPTACDLIKNRLWKLGADIRVENLPRTLDDFRRLGPLEFQNLIIKRVYGTHSPRVSGDMGIDGYSFFERLPIQIKQSDHIGRNVVDNFETAIRRAGKESGYIIAFSFGKGAYEEAARAKKDGLEIALIEVGTLLDDYQVAPLPGIDQLTADLLKAARLAAADREATMPPPPKVTAAEVIESERRRRKIAGEPARGRKPALVG